MSIEENPPGQEDGLASEQPYILIAQAEVDRARQLTAYHALVNFQKAHQLTQPVSLHALFTDTELLIPYKIPQVRRVKVFGSSLPLPSRKRIGRKIDEVELNTGNYGIEDERYNAFVRALPDLRMLIAFGNRTAANRHIHDRKSENMELTGGLGLTPEDLAKYNTVDLSHYDFDKMIFTPREVDFKLIWGKHGRLGGPKIDTRYIFLSLPDGKLQSPKTPNEWKTALEEAYSRIL